MILTVCTSDQYGHAMLLVESLKRHHPDQPILVGLAGTFVHSAPSDVTELAIPDTGLSPAQVAELSARYTATEFRAAIKPGLIKAAFERYPDEQVLLYIDPTAYVYQPLTPVLSQLEQHTILLNPHWLAAPADDRLPDEKHLQNVGLFSSGFIGFRRGPETDRMLDWWESRCLDHAAINFCIGSCLDQLWLMHVPTLFDGVGILKNPGVQVALWNLPQRTLTETPNGWQVTDQGGPNTASPLLTADFLGLSKQNEGLFQQQNRLQIRRRQDVQRLLDNYEKARLPFRMSTPSTSYGQQPEPVIVRGWRRTVKQKLTELSKWIDNVPIRPIHR